jgi:endonuclease YncB( thermonuclease family)
MNFRKSLKRNSLLVLGICLITVGFLIFPREETEIVQEPPPATTSLIPSSVHAVVTNVIDGDTIEIEGGQKVRYIGIDSSETYPEAECYSKEAKKKNEDLVLGKTVRLEKDVSETDKYGRLLRYVYVDNEFVNDELVKDGFAVAELVPPDEKYNQKFVESEEYARERGLGLWNGCSFK